MGFVSRVWTLAELRRYARDDARGCWVWQRYRRAQGYGQKKVHRRTVYAHRVAYELRHGPIPDGLVIHHECANKLCINPSHMRLMARDAHTAHHTPERVAAQQAKRLALRRVSA